jgi:transcriptional antiterminator NusG
MGWYALFVETGKEEQVKKHIHNTMSSSDASIPYELLIAKREIREKKDGMVRTVVKRMFPGYILLETESILEFYLRLKTTRCEHYFGILRNGGYFKEVRLEEISNIVYMTDINGVIGSSDIFIENDRIIVKKGPLTNYDGFIKKIDRRKHRVKVLFIFNGEKHYIDLSVNFIEKYDDNNSGKEIPFFTNKYFL